MVTQGFVSSVSPPCHSAPRRAICRRQARAPSAPPPPVPADFGAFLKVAGEEVARALDSGDERRLRVDLHAPDLQIGSRGYDPAALMRLIEEAVLSPIQGDKQVSLYFGGVAAVSAARAETDRSPNDLPRLVNCRMEIADGESIEPGAEPDIAVFVQPDSSNVLAVRKMIKDLTGRSTQLLINHRLTMGSAGEPVELIPFRSAIYLEPFAVRKISKDSKSPQGGPPNQEDEQAVRLALFAKYLTPWYLYLFSDEDQLYKAIKTLPQRPTSSQLQLIVQQELARIGRI